MSVSPALFRAARSGSWPSRDPDVFVRPGAASIRAAALWDAIYELSIVAVQGGGLPPETIQAMIDATIREHEQKPDPHPVYLTQPEGDARYMPLGTLPDLSNYWTKAEATARFADVAGDAFTGPVSVQGKALALSPDAANTLEWRANGLYSSASGGGGAPADTATLYREEWTSPTGSVLTLAHAPDVLVTVARNGVEQANGGLHFSQAGNVLTFSDAFVAGEQVVVAYAAGTAVAGASYTKAEADARFEPIDTMYTKAESDARYQPAGSYLTQATADARYLQLAAGGTVAGPVTLTLRPTVAGVAQPRISVQSGAPSSPATGDLWVW